MPMPGRAISCFGSPANMRDSSRLWRVCDAISTGRELISLATTSVSWTLDSRTTQESMMSSTTDKVKGATNEAVGKAKQGIGNAVGNDKMKVDGALQEAKGDTQKAVGNAKDAVKKAIDR